MCELRTRPESAIHAGIMFRITSIRHYASIIVKIFDIIWKAFCLMQIFRGLTYVLRMQYYNNISGNTMKTIKLILNTHFHKSVTTLN